MALCELREGNPAAKMTNNGTTKLPRIEVQFICDIANEIGFNATDVVEDFIGNFMLTSNFNNTNSDNQTNSEVVLPEPYDPQNLLLYVTAAANTVRDVSPFEWYYDQCDISSSDSDNHHNNNEDDDFDFGFRRALETNSGTEKTLVTIDVSGYYHWSCAPLLLTIPSHKTLQSYMASTVCARDSLDYFQADILDWSINYWIYPSEIDENNIDESMGNIEMVYPSSSMLLHDGSPVTNRENLRNADWYHERWQEAALVYKYRFEHNLCVLCDLPSPCGYPPPGPSVPFLIFGIVVGFLIVLMIRAEFAKPLRYQQLPPRSGTRSFWGLFRWGTATAVVSDGDYDSDEFSDESSNSNSAEEDEEHSNGQEIELAALNQ